MIKQKLLDIQSANLKTHIVWIPSHSGILGNETVDHLAKRAITYGQFMRTPLPHTDLFSTLRTEFIADSSKLLKNQDRRKKQIFSRLWRASTKALKFHKLDLNRESIVTCCRIRSNHYALNYSLHRCNLVRDPTCLCGFPIQDADHIFWSCPILNNQRSTLLTRLAKLKKSPPHKVADLLLKPSSEVIHSLYSFLKSANIFIWIAPPIYLTGTILGRISPSLLDKTKIVFQ